MLRIFRNWRQQSWHTPLLYETDQPDDQTVLELRMISLLRPETVAALKRRFGARVERLGETERLALITVEEERSLNHSRLKEICWEHPHDISRTLARLVEGQFLASDGAGRGTVYFFKGENPRGSQSDLFQVTDTGSSSQRKEPSSQHLPPSSQHKEGSSQRKDAEMLHTLAESVRSNLRSSRSVVESVILKVCTGRHLTVQELADLLGRKPLSLQNHYLNRMVKQRLLRLKFPEKRSSPNQAYTTTESAEPTE